MASLFVTLALSVLALVLLRDLWAFLTCRLAHLPGPLHTRSPLLTFVSLLPAMPRGKVAEHTAALVRKYGPIVRTAPNRVSCADPALLSAAMATSDGFLKDPRIYLPGAGGVRDLFATIERDAHRAMRRKLSPAFSVRSLAAMQPIVAGVVEEFVAKLDGMAERGEQADFLKLFGLATGEVIGEVAFGERWGLIKKGHSDVLEKSEASVKAYVFNMIFGDAMIGILYLLFPFIRKGIAAYEDLNKYALGIVRDRRAGKTPRRDDLLQRMVDAIDSETGEALTDQEVASNCLLLITAGDETTAHQLSFTTYLLLTHPSALASLVAELDRAAASHGIAREALLPHSALKDLPYLDAVLRESLRLMPTTSSVTERVAPADWTHPSKPGIFVPAGTSIECLNGPASRDPAAFGPDADSFVPERWLGEKGLSESQVKWNFLPFSRGPHNCIGSGLAMVEMRMLVGNAFRRYTLKLADAELAAGRRGLRTCAFLTSAPEEGELVISVSRR
ncbi:cytochrome P450 [Hyaloraphidium curvatum]|nr:cytochrome P450 [Hyaloraphidium curvatum]